MADYLGSAFLIVGALAMLLAGVGVLRMPDLFMRMQAATKATTLGAGCMLTAVAIHFGDLGVASRAMLVTIFIFTTAPIAAHVIARAAYSVGVPLWDNTLYDQLREHANRQAADDEPAPPIPDANQ